MTAPAAPTAPHAPLNLRALLEEMIARDASDLHITAGERPKLRVDGEIVNAAYDGVLGPKDTLQLAYSVLFFTLCCKIEEMILLENWLGNVI